MYSKGREGDFARGPSLEPRRANEKYYINITVFLRSFPISSIYLQAELIETRLINSAPHIFAEYMNIMFISAHISNIIQIII